RKHFCKSRKALQRYLHEINACEGGYPPDRAAIHPSQQGNTHSLFYSRLGALTNVQSSAGEATARKRPLCGSRAESSPVATLKYAPWSTSRPPSLALRTHGNVIRLSSDRLREASSRRVR